MGRVANIITYALILLSLAAIVGFAVLFISPDLVSFGPTSTPRPSSAAPTIAAVAVVPSLTPTPTDDGRLRPTFTPVATEPPLAAQPTNTRRPTLTPSVTPIIPSRTATPTPSNTPTITPTPGPSPTATFTQSPFPFTKSPDSPIYLKNFANGAECDWMGIAGEVLDTNGLPVGSSRYRVHIWDSGVDERVPVGGAPAYGPSGYEQFLFSSPVIRNYNVQLETTSGTAVSQVYRVQTRSSCNENLVYLIFLQNR
ncbi:MAG: hypothetical protein QNJ45_01445 [Ardenticatenaceae bacterium]|nr:hypothetical protein [Ardenticatenaceae bacterium]